VFCNNSAWSLITTGLVDDQRGVLSLLSIYELVQKKNIHLFAEKEYTLS
jgi:hypothetical protein